MRSALKYWSEERVIYGLLIILHSQGISKTLISSGFANLPKYQAVFLQDSHGRALLSYTSAGEEGARSSALNSHRENKCFSHREIKMRKINREHL